MAEHAPLSCDEARELLAIAALEGDTARPNPALDAHCASCPECLAARDEYREVTGLLAFGLVDAPAAPEVRDRLRLRVARERRSRRPWQFTAGIAAAVVLALFAGVAAGAWMATQNDQEANNYSEASGDRFALTPDEAGQGAHGEVVIDHQTGAAILTAHDLPPLGANEVYQMWFLREDGSRINAFTFRPDSDGDAVHAVALPQDWTGIAGCGVTREPASGSNEPTGPSVLVAWWQ
ncbi:MAG: anti-sigma factor [Hyphomicrobiales bacterium]